MEILSKALIIESIQNMPNEQVDMEDVIERIIVLSKVERARRQIDSGQCFDNDSMKQMVKEWHTK